jgi:hypothetical protein
MAKLDRVLASVSWDSKYPLSNVRMLPKGCSDHNPLRVSFGVRASLFLDLKNGGLKCLNLGRWLGKPGTLSARRLTRCKFDNVKLGI